MKLIIEGRCLFLSEDPEKIHAQLAGHNLTLKDCGKLRDDISTDEIITVPNMCHYDETLKYYPYTGFHIADKYPIKFHIIDHNNFSITVAGERYGKGSSREHAPVAEYSAGIRLVIAKSFEYIYRQNADNIGLLTSTDFSLLDRVNKGETITLDEIIADRDPLTQAILRSGGLLKYGQHSLHDNKNGKFHVNGSFEENTSYTYAEKILLRHLLLQHHSKRPTVGEGCFVEADRRFIVEVYTGMAFHLLKKTFDNNMPLYKPESIIAFEDHFAYKYRSKVHIENNLIPSFIDLSNAHRSFVAEYGIKSHGYLHNEDGSEGISHSLMAERYVLPGEVVTGTDSHTTHSGGVGCIAFGVGTTNLTNAMLTGKVRLNWPSVLKVELQGVLTEGVTAKDIALKILSLPQIKAGDGVGKIFEFSGSIIKQLSTDERCTLTNMTTELGGMCGIIIPDEETVRFIKERRGIDIKLSPWMHSDKHAHYAQTITIDCSQLRPMLALPGDPSNGVSVYDMKERIPIDIAYGGSCTAGKREDFDYYHEVLHWALNHGLSIFPHVKLFLQFGSVDVRDYCAEKGYLQTFEKMNLEMLQPQCGACCNCGPGASEFTDQVTISSGNRNFPGRLGPGKVWLASPSTVIASAIAGYIIAFNTLKQSF